MCCTHAICRLSLSGAGFCFRSCFMVCCIWLSAVCSTSIRCGYRLLNGSLYPTLTELEQTAAAMKKQLMADLLAKNPAPDKEKDQMAWVQHMNSLQEQVEEVIRTELIYS